MKAMRILLLIIAAVAASRGMMLRAGEEAIEPSGAESRFPPLVVAAGFKATLFACDPLIEYPSAISSGPRPGAIFVAVDYMTGLGTEIVRQSEVRLVEDNDGDGVADRATLFAGGFNSIMGLAYHQGALYVMHAPLLTVLRDTKCAGRADERNDILSGLGLSPEQNPVRLHCANGVTPGHDGWLYLAMGDHGCDVRRLEGDRLVLQGGGVLRCRADGSDLHVFATGLRNIYDVALDEALNVFVRDNENDGGDYKIRLCQSFFGADHGYPYLYYERPLEALPPLVDLGLGSSAGGVCYLEDRFPVEYRGSLFFCEWGNSLVRYSLRRLGSSFAPPNELEFAKGADSDPYGFRPTDVVVQRDGTLMVSDYADGQRPKRGRGRIYHIDCVDGARRETPHRPADPLAMLDSSSYYERCDAQQAVERAGEEGLELLREALAAGRIGPHGRLHAVWILAHLQGAEALEPLFSIAASDRESAVRIQAIRAIADLADPVLARHRLDAPSGDAELAARLAALGKRQAQQVLLEIVVALGRLRWSESPRWLRENLVEPDAAITHAAMLALRHSGNWPAILELLDAPESDPLRGIALRSVAGQYECQIVDRLLERLSHESDKGRLLEYADYLARVYKKPGPWKYWGYRPGPRPANEVAWERSEVIAGALGSLITHADPTVRVAALQYMDREKVPVSLAALGKWLSDDTDNDRVAAVLSFLSGQPPTEVHPYLAPVIQDRRHSGANRLAAVDMFLRGTDKDRAESLVGLAQHLEDGPVLAATLRALGGYPHLSAKEILKGRLASIVPDVRVAAIEALSALNAPEARESILLLLADSDARVRRAAAQAAGSLGERRAIEGLLDLAVDGDPLVRAASFESLRLLGEPSAVPIAVAALGDQQTQQSALKYLHDLGDLEQSGPVADLARRHPTVEVLMLAARSFTQWSLRPAIAAEERAELDRAVAEMQGASGVLIRWKVSGPERATDDVTGAPPVQKGSRTVFADGTEGLVVMSPQGAGSADSFHAWTDVAVTEQTAVELFVSSSGSRRLWLNGESIHHRPDSGGTGVDLDRVPTMLAKGSNVLSISVKGRSSELAIEFQLFFRRKRALAEQERLVEAALTRSGDLQRGREVLLNVEKSLCLKCHRLNTQGESVGPDLTGLGSRFSRVHITESILEPSQAVAPSFSTVIAQLQSGQTLSGIKVAEDDSTVTLVDSQAEKHQVARATIERQESSALSTMPEGLEKRLTEQEFVDLVAFLASLKDDRALIDQKLFRP